MLAPISHPYPPPGYGPWERVTHDLTEALVGQGHDVTLFSPADSRTRAKHVPTLERSLAGIPEHRHRELEDQHIRMALAEAKRRDLDVVHSHLHLHVLEAATTLGEIPLLTTLHGAAWNADIASGLREHRHRPFVSLSDYERTFAPELNYVATVGNGVQIDEFPIGPGSGAYLIFAGRIAPEKATHLAVEVARRVGMPLRIAGPIEPRHKGYAEDVLARRGVEYLGTLDRRELAEAFGDASVLLMPLAWDEPFGLVVVESMLCGTPVIAWRRGAMPEIVQQGVTGFLVDDVQEAVRSMEGAKALSRRHCAETASQNFSADAMASRYADVYAELAQRHTTVS